MPESPISVKGRLREIGGHDRIGDHFGADMLGLCLHLFHQPRALNGLGKARIVFDFGGDGELSAGLDAADQHRFEHSAGRIDRRRTPGRTTTQNDDFRWPGMRHIFPLAGGNGEAAQDRAACPLGVFGGLVLFISEGADKRSSRGAGKPWADLGFPRKH